MAPKKYLAGRVLTSFVFLTLAVLQPSMQQHSSESIAEDLDSTIAMDATPTAFLVVDVSLIGEDGISLTWSDLGPNFVYTVEFSNSVTGRWDIVPPVEQWPIGETSWTDTSASDSSTRFYRIQTEALYDPPAAPTDVSAGVEEGEVVIRWDAVPGASSYNVYWSTDAELLPTGATKIEDVSSPFTHSALDFGVTYYYVVTAVGNKGESDVSSVVSVTYSPPLDQTVATTMHDATEFLYTGDNPIQTGVEEGTIEPRRVAVLRGKVLTRDGEPLPGVTITMLNHPEYGQTLSRADGMFDLAVNGGGYLTVDCEKDGHLPAQRQANVPWQDYVRLPDVVLIPLDTQVTVVDFSEPMQAAQGSSVTDECGTRQAALLFPQDTQASMVMPDGSTQPLTSFSVRATEYTVGENGPKAMPAELPPQSGYTYCVEFSADEALAAGAKDVQFDRPVINYLENFLGASVGSIVPVGYYDRTKGAWIPSDNGLVIEILSINGGLAELDVDGSGQMADAQALADLGITDAERQRLAGLYEPDQSLWRVSITHFSPWDCNWPYGPPEDAEPPDQPPPEQDEHEEDPCEETGSIIEAQNQVLGEAVDVIGTPFSLHYRSDRVPGRKAAYTLKIPLSGPTVPESLIGIELEIHVAGRLFTHSIGRDHPCLLQTPSLAAASVGATAIAPESDATDLANQSYTFTWDGKDAYGRTLQGLQPATVRIGHVYCGVYMQPAQEDRSFAQFSGVSISGSRTRREVVLWQEWKTRLGVPWDAHGLGLAGWSLDAHHVYDPVSRVLYRGDGSRRSAEVTGQVITTEVILDSPWGVAVGPDGSLYVADKDDNRIRRVDPDGIITTVAGTGTWGYRGDGGPATSARLATPHGVAAGPDGSFYIADSANHRIRRVDPNGIITTVAGTGSQAYGGDGGPAVQAQLGFPEGIAVAFDGSLYIADSSNARVRRVDPDGIITTVAGDGTWGYAGDGGPASAAKFKYPSWIGLGPIGALYIADPYNNCIRRVGVDGIIMTVAGTGTIGFSGDGGPAAEAELNFPYAITVGADGALYIADTWNHRIRRVGPDGIIMTVVGDPAWDPVRKKWAGAYSGDGGLAAAAELDAPFGVAMGPNGTLYVADTQNLRIRRVSPPFPGYSAGDIAIPAEDGSEVYVFNNGGRHLGTQDALANSVIHSFRYDDSGRLTEIEDADGNITTIERDANGDPMAIVGPYGHRTELSLGADGYLAGISDPLGNSVQLTYWSDGLLETFTDPKGATYRYTYNSMGRLAQAEDPAGGYKNLTRTEIANGYEVTVETALGRTTTYRVESLPTGEKRLTNTFCCGKENEILAGTDGRSTMTLADGTAIDAVQGPDPRWGMQAPVGSNAISTTPMGRRLTVEGSRNATLTDPDLMLSLETFSQTVNINGRIYNSLFDAGSRTFTDTTPASRQSTTTLDAQGRVIEVQEAGLAPVSYSYDSNGRLASITSGAAAETRTIGLSYGNDGYLATITDPLGQTTGFAYDAAGRVTAQTLPDAEIIQFSYDASSNVTSITPPGRPAHTFVDTAVDLLSRYSPPDVGAGSNQVVYTYDADGQVTGITREDGQTVGLTYDDAGRLIALILRRGQVNYSYDATTGQMHTITMPDGSTLSYDYDGSLLAAETWTGAVAGGVDYTYDDDFRTNSVGVNGGNTIAFEYNEDSELTQVGELVVTWDPQNGLVTSTAVGNTTEAWAYNGFGETVGHSAAHDGMDLYAVQHTRDKLGRIIEKTETVGGLTDVFRYTFNAAGRLVEVQKNDIAIATYTHDSNGNRLSHTGAGGTVSGAYDDQDRLLQYGATTYTCTPNGDLLTKTNEGQTTTYEYDALGNLIAVTLRDGTEIEYLADGESRRIGKKVNGALVQGFLYWDQVNPIAELDGAGNLVSLFVYATRANVPAYMVKDGTTYCIISDHLGSPRLVVNTGTGEIVQRMDYDEFGNAIQDTNPGFQPFGFAGGIYDRHTKLVRFGARDYDAQTGRWTSRDPLLFEGGQTNLYTYVDNDPINRIDPLGTGWWKDMLDTIKRIAPDAAEEARKAAEEAAKQRRPPPPPKPMPRNPVPDNFRGAPGGSWGLRCLYPWIVIDPQLLKRMMCEKMPSFPGCPPSAWHVWRQRQTS